MGSFSGESPARTSAKGDRDGTEKPEPRVGNQCHRSAVSPGVRPALPQHSCKEGCSRDHLETSNLGSEMRREKQEETAIAANCCGVRCKFSSPGVGARTQARFWGGKGKAQDWLPPLPSSRPVEYPCAAPAPIPEDTPKAPIPSHPQPCIRDASPACPRGEGSWGSQKSPTRSVMQPLGRAARERSEIPAKYTQQPRCGANPGSKSSAGLHGSEHPEKPRLQMGCFIPRDIFWHPREGERWVPRGTGNASTSASGPVFSKEKKKERKKKIRKKKKKIPQRGRTCAHPHASTAARTHVQP